MRFLGADEQHAGRMSREYRDIREARREAREEWREARREGRDGYGAIELFGRTDFRGRSLRLEDNAWDLAAQQFDGRISSVVVLEGTWQLCTEPGFQGRCSTLTPGEYRQLAALDDRVSPLRQLR